MIVFPELRYCFCGITGIDACESRGYQIQVRHSSGRVRTGGRMPPVRWKIPSRFEQGEATILRLVPALSESRKSLCLNVNPKR